MYQLIEYYQTQPVHSWMVMANILNSKNYDTLGGMLLFIKSICLINVTIIIIIMSLEFVTRCFSGTSWLYFNQIFDISESKMSDISELKKNIIYGASALYASMFVQILHPFDVIKTRLQSHDGYVKGNIVPNYGGIGGAIKGIYKQEGLRGFTKGIFVSLVANGSSRILFFTFYEPMKDNLLRKHGIGSKTAVLLTSLYAGFLTSLMTQPIWVMYIRMQLNTKKSISVVFLQQLGISKLHWNHIVNILIVWFIGILSRILPFFHALLECHSTNKLL